jgi:hypothetical protein
MILMIQADMTRTTGFDNLSEALAALQTVVHYDGE